MLDVSFEAEPHNHCVKLLQERAEVLDEIVADEPKERMLAFLKEVVLILEAINVVPMQVVQHVVTTIPSSLELLPLSLLVLSVIDPDQC